MRRKCPPALKKYGWCGVLALLYATNLPMPTTELQFAKCLASLKKILGANMPRWAPSRLAKTRGGITTTQTATVLSHYHMCCGYSLDRVKERGVVGAYHITRALNSWLPGAARVLPAPCFESCFKWASNMQDQNTFLVRGSAFGVPVDADRPRCRQTRTPGGRVRVGARPLESMGAAGQRDQLVIFEQ